MYKMINTPVIFKAEKVFKGDWQLKCHCPGGKIDYVTGFLDEQSIKNWLITNHCAHWLKVRGYRRQHARLVDQSD